jgi:phosphatidylserine synthase
MKDNTPAILAVAVFIGFFGILGVLMFSKVPTQSLSSLNVMLGALATIIVQVAAYYFGSSRGSAEKNRTIAGLMGR